MTSPFRVQLAEGRSARAVRVNEENQLRAALDALDLRPPRPTVVVVGGAAGLDDAGMERLRPVFGVGVAPVMDKHRAVGVDGGTRFGVMRLFGQARVETRGRFSLLGVVAAGPVELPEEQVSGHLATVLDPHHTHFLVVPGEEWGAESPWIARTATVLAGTAPSVTVLINGGQIAHSDVQRSVEIGRPVVAIAGSGRTADQFAGALAGGTADERTAALVGSGMIRSIPVEEPDVLAELLDAALSDAAAI